MTREEVARRLAALLAQKPEERPISFVRLDQLCGFYQGTSRDIARVGRMANSSYTRLDRALTWVENDQVVVTRKQHAPSDITIRPPRPPQVTVTLVKFTAQGPKLRSLALNPRAFETPHTKAKGQ